MRMWSFILVLGLTVGSSVRAEMGNPRHPPVAERVVVVADRNQTQSVKLAETYMKMRHIPRGNLLLLRFPEKEILTWDEYLQYVHDPILDFLVEKQLLEVVDLDAVGPAGRRQFMTTRNRVDFLVLCKGVPLKIAHDAARLPNPQSLAAQFRTNRASIDSQLSALPIPESQVNGPLRNPVHQESPATDFHLQKILRVSRLDGPRFEDCFRMLERTRQAESKGLRGRAYLDTGGPHSHGDKWLKAAGEQMRALGFDLSEESTKQVFAEGDRFDAPAIYFGWYKGSMTGVFNTPGVDFAPGAIALHIHSFSADTLRSETRGWTGPLVAKGAVATVGNVNEPYLEFTHLPHLLMEGLAAGLSWGEAAYYSLPSISWQPVLIGDPLYQPFARSVEDQLEGPADLADPLQQYAVIRAVNLRKLEKGAEAALVQGDRWFFQSPGLALALCLAQLADEVNRPEKAKYFLNTASRVRVHSVQDTGILFALAREMDKHLMYAEAQAMFQTLIDGVGLPKPLLAQALQEGSRIARQNGNMTLYLKWNDQLATLKQAPAPQKK